MKKKTMQTLFILLFTIGLVVGYILPGDIKSLAKKPLQAGFYDVAKRMGQLDLESPYFKYSVLSEAQTGSIELIRLDDKIPMHMHPKENHFVYIYKGRAKATIRDVTQEVGPGNLLAIPAGTQHSIERVGDAPLEIILFSTPPFMPNDTVWLEKQI
ncbi:cupin domain-containing protein [Candidatus Woesearchaeota archaeon]|nr:cupin domain-containing protein [Candidatus Woesearchaeota archaeon]